MKTRRVVSMNIRRCRGDDGKNIWANRRPLLADVLKKYHPDIIGFQEVLIHQLKDLIRMFPDYQYVGVGRDDGKEAGEFSPIFFSRNLNIEQSDTFWLSDTPEIPSCTWGGQTRICTWAVISEPIPFAFLNTHIEYEFIQAQINSMELLINKAKEYEDSMPLLLIGDFNCRPGSKPYKILSASMRDSYLEDPRNKEDRFVSSHGFTGLKLATGQTKEGRIDYIWIKGDVHVEQCCILFDHPGDDPDLYPSDHWPIMCDISFG